MFNLIYIQIPCNHLIFIKWLRGHLLPCPFKYVTGFDCPGCGFQRSVLELFQGDFAKSFQLYPAAIPLLLFFIYGILDGIFKLDTRNSLVKKTGYMIVGTMILVSYVIKLYGLYAHYKVSI